MSKRKQRIETPGDIDPVVAEATDWFVALHEDPANSTDDPAFQAWRNADPRHAATYDRLSRLWGAAGHLPSLTASGPDMERRALLRRGVGAGALAALALCGGRLALGPNPLADHRTGTGERRTVMLADGSRAELSTATALSVDFSGSRRVVRLLDGEAWFQVAPDPSRPFAVETAGGVATALGTAFAVAREEGGARVTVTQHAVRVQASPIVRTVGEGQSLRYGPGREGRVEEANLSSLSWRGGRLAFVNRPLSEVAATLDRWTGRQTLITDGALGARLVTLMIATDEVEQGLLKLAAEVPMRITRLTSLLTIIRPS